MEQSPVAGRVVGDGGHDAFVHSSRMSGNAWWLALHARRLGIAGSDGSAVNSGYGDHAPRLGEGDGCASAQSPKRAVPDDGSDPPRALEPPVLVVPRTFLWPLYALSDSLTLGDDRGKGSPTPLRPSRGGPGSSRNENVSARFDPIAPPRTDLASRPERPEERWGDAMVRDGPSDGQRDGSTSAADG